MHVDLRVCENLKPLGLAFIDLSSLYHPTLHRFVKRGQVYRMLAEPDLQGGLPEELCRNSWVWRLGREGSVW